MNIRAVVVAAASSFHVGGLWYSPLLFRKLWNAKNASMPARNLRKLDGETFRRSNRGSGMNLRMAVILVSVLLGLSPDMRAAAADEVLTYKLAMVVLVEDPATRAVFEDGLAAKFRANDYDAIASHEFVPNVTDLGSTDLVGRLAEAGVQGIVMLRPAAVGAGSSLESVKNEISRDIYADMRAFARETSPGIADDELVAVVHTAIYMVRDGRVELLSAGAVWLDEPVETRDEGIGKLQDLIVLNMNKARPAVREYLGLPPIED